MPAESRAEGPALTVIQPASTISAPGDVSEREADRVADTVMRMPTPDPALDGRDSGRSAPAGPGLPASVRGFFETRFGHDFGRVRVHAAGHAAEMARGFHARAFTVGHDIYFGAGHYAPGTRAGDTLLAHELTHTIQQGRGGPWVQRKEEVAKTSVTEENPLERHLKGAPPGLTTPLVNGVAFNDINNVDAALPRKINFARGSTANTCRVKNPIDVISRAQIVTADKPGKSGWTASAPFATVKGRARISDPACEAKKGNIDVRLVARHGE